MTLGEVIVKLRKSAGLNQLELAESCGLSQTYLSHIENGKRQPHADSLNKISEALGVPMEVLYFLSLTDKSVPEHKREAFNMLLPSIKAFITEFFPKTKILQN